jgi:hypothetical protein
MEAVGLPPATGQVLINLSPASTAKLLESGEKRIWEILRANPKDFCNSGFKVAEEVEGEVAVAVAVAIAVGKSI